MTGEMTFRTLVKKALTPICCKTEARLDSPNGPATTQCKSAHCTR
jgi:hypothetical protein